MPKNYASLWDLTLHNLSMQVARLHREAYFEGRDDEAANLLTAYRAIRRNIKFAPNGKRYGASEAYAVTQNAKL